MAHFFAIRKTAQNGGRMAEQCGACGIVLKGDEKFCGACGAAVAIAASPKPATLTPSEHFDEVHNDDPSIPTPTSAESNRGLFGTWLVNVIVLSAAILLADAIVVITFPTLTIVLVEVLSTTGVYDYKIFDLIHNALPWVTVPLLSALIARISVHMISGAQSQSFVRARHTTIAGIIAGVTMVISVIFLLGDHHYFAPDLGRELAPAAIIAAIWGAVVATGLLALIRLWSKP